MKDVTEVVSHQRPSFLLYFTGNKESLKKLKITIVI